MAARPKATSPAPVQSNLDSYFALLAGLFFALALTKWGNPVILDSKIATPQNFLDAVFSMWPISWDYWVAAPLAALGCGVALKVRSAKPEPAPGTRPNILRWFCLLPLIWLGWQGLSALQTVDRELTRVTLQHFAGCTVFFYLGYFGVRNPRNTRLIWVGFALGLACVLRAGFDQHFGGLEATRNYVYSQPGWQDLSPETLKKLASNRIYSTLCYPNTLAGGILLLLPLSIGLLWTCTGRFSKMLRFAFCLVAAFAGAACLYWSGSKAGWLLALILGIVALLHAPLARKWKICLVCGVMVVGLAGFGLRYAGYFQRGSTSVSARFDYWRAATVIARKHPIVGTGPGTFLDEYRKIKAHDAEFARLAHNDYLQQASDSGVPGFVFFTTFFAGSLFMLYRGATRRFDVMRFTVWLGVLGLSLHSLVEFHLYIPALAWPIFFLFGWGTADYLAQKTQT